MSKRSARQARTSSSSSHSLPSPKRNRARFSSDEMEANEENVSLKQILDKLACMEDRIEEHFGSLKSEISRLSAEFKEEVENIKTNLKEVEKSLQSAWDSINDLEADAKTHSDFKKASQQALDSHLQQINLLKTSSGNAAYQNQQKEIRALQASLAQEREKIIALENYSRRENLRFMNIPERRDENCVDVVYDIIENELNIDPDNIQFHAVHRIGKPREATDANPRPIIARFLCREDRDNIYRVKNRLKKSRKFENAYITQDYAQAIQLERKVLIKAMFLAREKGAIAKVVDRKLIIGSDTFHINNIPEEFRPPTTESTNR
ncbi:CDK5 regulatory subunit-associated protein 2-like [Montipora capricornis]|uniref:CDK5 regulatory subunit-associated protein 2-like n=1 Tax=Montipora capricornis TaxID=246305 RepID=UPI0035F16C82